jgi:hypothetical protein
MAPFPAPLFADPGETAEAFALRQEQYAAAYKAASLDVYTTGFLIAGAICLAAIVFAIWLRPKPGSDVEAGPIF